MGKKKKLKALKKRVKALEKAKTKVHEIGYLSPLYDKHDQNDYDYG